MTLLGDPPCAPLQSTEALDANLDGSVICGELGIGGGFQWTQATGLQCFNSFSGTSQVKQVNALNADGTVLVGNGPPAFRWSHSQGMEYVFGPADGRADATDVSADGQSVVGWIRIEENGEESYRAVRRDASGRIEDLGDLFEGADNHASAISGDGRVVVGWSYVWAFRWTEETGMQPIRRPGGLPVPWAHDVNYDGTVIVGGAEGYVWHARRGARTLAQLLDGYGVNVGSFLDLRPYGVSDDGTRIVGYGYDGARYTAFLAVLPPFCYADCHEDGLLDIFDYLCFEDLFVQGNWLADCDESGSVDLFDLICFQDAFVTGCS